MRRIFFVVCFAIISSTAFAQDKFYKHGGEIISCEVVAVSYREIKFRLENKPTSPYHYIRKMKVDSVVLADGRSHSFRERTLEESEPTHLRTKNTFSIDPLGLLASSVTVWYERRVWDGKLGIRIPLYLCFNQNYSPGFNVIEKNRPKPLTIFPFGGTLIPNPHNPNLQSGFAFATGINLKFYLNKHKIVRAFAGPETDFGYTAYPRNTQFLDYIDYYPNYYRTGNFQAAGMAGININPIGHFNISVEGGAGYNIALAKNFNYGNPVWRVGLSLGGSF